MKKIVIGLLIVVLILLLFMGMAVAGGMTDSEEVEGVGLSDAVLAFRPLVDELAAEHGVSAYVWHLLAIIQVESGGLGLDIMGQAAFMSGDVMPEGSIRTGVMRFANLREQGRQLGVDIGTVVQAFDFGITFLSYVQRGSGVFTLELAMSYARARSGGDRVDDRHPLVVVTNGGWRYDFGNMFYAMHVSRYLTSAAPRGGGSGASTGQFLWPTPGFYRVTSGFGWRIHPITGDRRHHNGIDIAGAGINGSNIIASDGGVIVVAGWLGSFGNYIRIDHGNGYMTSYAHNSANLVRVGDRVRQGQVIGRVGSTGGSTGPHLHFEIRRNNVRVDPMQYFR